MSKLHPTFVDYYSKNLKSIKIASKRDGVTVKEWIKYTYGETLSQYRNRQKRQYTKKFCNSFWHRECENKYTDICKKCKYFYSYSDRDKMTPKERKYRY